MTIGVRLFLGYFVVVGLGVYFLTRAFMTELKPGVRQTAEETLVDTANLLAEVVKPDLERGVTDRGTLAASVAAYERRRIHARIWSVLKTRPSYRIYVTDHRGIVLYDSEGKAVGKDYSRWNDVLRTLRGEYGSRSTRADPNDERSTVMHVAAPIQEGDRILGVLTVAKPNHSVDPFIELGRRKMTRAGIVLVLLSLGVGIAFSAWLSRSIRRVATYAQQVSEGRRVAPPQFSGGELALLGRSVAQMRQELDGKAYVERYVHTLTHEMKSPLAAMRAAAELLEEEMEPAARRTFLRNIRSEVERMSEVIDRLLDLARIEGRQALEQRSRVEVTRLLDEVTRAQMARAASRQVALEVQGAPGAAVDGDPFLLRQALHNLLDNALAFTPAGGTIRLDAKAERDQVQIRVHNSGSAIPDYARDRLFERFYSLPRPDTGKKSTGLGLSFVKEVASLHGGTVEVRNHPDGGVVATLGLPAARPA